MPLKLENNLANQGIFGLIGSPVAHSLSPLMWNSAFSALAYPAVYLAFEVAESSLKEAFNGLSALGIKGINVTRPYKSAVAGLCETLIGPAAKLIAVNTVKFGSGKIIGYNTDAIAFKTILKPFCEGKNALILGNGDTAMAAAWALAQSHIGQVSVISRRETPVPDFFASPKIFFWADWNSKNLQHALRTADLVINTTPLGWKQEDKIPELETGLNKQQIFFDVNYGKNSQLTEAAVKNGCRVIDGRELLLLQAMESFRLLTELEPPEKIMRSCIF